MSTSARPLRERVGVCMVRPSTSAAPALIRTEEMQQAQQDERGRGDQRGEKDEDRHEDHD